MVTADALSEVLGAVDLRIGIAGRATLTSGGLLPIPSGAMTLVYVAGGSVHGHPPLGEDCRLQVDPGSRRITVEPRAGRQPLVVGDALLSMGGSSFALQADGDARLIVVDLEFADATSPLRALLPPLLIVTGFDALEPAAAALAEHMGPVDAEVCPGRPGDLVICRMMATTVLLSVIRA